MTTVDDQHYINLVIKGDRNAFAVLVDRYKDMVFTLVMKMVKHREQAEDLSQEIFIKVFRSLAGFKGDSKFSTWLYKVAYNSCLDHLKSNRAGFELVLEEDISNERTETIEDVFEKIDSKERKELINYCLNLLPAEDQFLLTLYYLEELSVKEVAAVMGINTNHVKIKLHRGRKKLVAILLQKLEPELISQYENGR